MNESIKKIICFALYGFIAMVLGYAAFIVGELEVLNRIGLIAVAFTLHAIGLAKIGKAVFLFTMGYIVFTSAILSM